jgi:hypothetical protein
MTYWRDGTCLWTADESLHAGITRGMLQDNATVLGEQAVTDVCTQKLGSGMFSLLSTLVPLEWQWSQYIPQPIRALKSADGVAWRDVYVEVLTERAAVGSANLRIFLLPDQAAPIIDPTTGIVPGYDYYTVAVPALGFAGALGGWITPSATGSKYLAGCEFPILWVHVAVIGTASTRLYSLRVREDQA